MYYLDMGTLQKKANSYRLPALFHIFVWQNEKPTIQRIFFDQSFHLYSEKKSQLTLLIRVKV